MLKRQLVAYTWDGVAGEALQTLNIPVPRACRTLKYTYYVNGAANPISNSLRARMSYGSTFAAVPINTTIFSSAALGGAGNLIVLTGCSFLQWLYRSNAGVPNQFYLDLEFHD